MESFISGMFRKPRKASKQQPNQTGRSLLLGKHKDQQKHDMWENIHRLR